MNLKLQSKIKQLKIIDIFGNIIEFENSDGSSLYLDIATMNKIGFFSKKQ